MSDPLFFRSARPLSLAVIAARGVAAVPAGADPARLFLRVADLDAARGDAIAVAADDNALADLRVTRAGACFVSPRHRDRVPAGTIALVTDDPITAFRCVAALLHPDSTTPAPVLERGAIHPSAIVHRDALLEPGVGVDPGVVIGPRAEIGSGTTVGAGTTIGADVRIGRDCAIDVQVSVRHALVGDRVVIHAGARIGHAAIDGPAGGSRVPYLGRVIIQDGAAIGANAVVARGTMGDTVIGEASRVDALAVVECDATIDRLARVRRNDVDDARPRS